MWEADPMRGSGLVRKRRCGPEREEEGVMHREGSRSGLVRKGGGVVPWGKGRCGPVREEEGVIHREGSRSGLVRKGGGVVQ